MERATRSAVRWRVPVSDVGMVALGIEVHVGPGDAGGVGGQDDGAVHLGQLGEALGVILGVEEEAAGADGEHGRVVAHEDQRPVLRLQDPVEALAERGARRDQRQRVVQRLAAAGTVDHPGIVPGPFRRPASERPGPGLPPACARRAPPCPPARPRGRLAHGQVEAGTSALVKPARCASARRRSAPGTVRTSPASPSSPKATRSAGRAPAGDDRRHGQRDGEVGRRLGDRDAADGGDEELGGHGHVDRGAAGEHGHEQVGPGRVDAQRVRPRRGPACRARAGPAPRRAGGADPAGPARPRCRGHRPCGRPA